MVYWFSQVITKLFDVIVAPFGDNRMAALSVISLVTGVALIFLFKATSDQKRIKDTRDKFKARILEMRIYQDDIVLIHKALFKALATNLVYLRVSLKPILVLIAFVFLIFVQLDERYGRRHLHTGEKSLFTVTLEEGLDPMDVAFDLAAGDGVAIDSPPVRAGADRQISWRVRVTDPGTHDLTVQVYDQSYAFPVRAERSNAPVAQVRTDGSVWNPPAPPLSAPHPQGIRHPGRPAPLPRGRLLPVRVADPLAGRVHHFLVRRGLDSQVPV